MGAKQLTFSENGQQTKRKAYIQPNEQTGSRDKIGYYLFFVFVRVAGTLSDTTTITNSVFLTQAGI
mgnify:CR=1 FL=1